jgi:hypothetical protein
MTTAMSSTASTRFLITCRNQYRLLMRGLKNSSTASRTGRLRRLCRTDLFFPLVYGLGRRDADNDWCFARCREVQAEPNGYLDLWARDHYKSSIITFALTIQDVLNDPEVTIGIFSHTRPNAKAFLRQIKQERERNELLKELFPDILWAGPQKDSSKWSEDDGIIVKRKTNPKESTIEAWGSSTASRRESTSGAWSMTTSSPGIASRRRR